MSKVQSAIEAAKARALRSPTSRSGIYRKPAVGKGAEFAAPVKLENDETLYLDAKRMERACLLPFVADKGATSAYNLLRTRVLQRMRENAWTSMMVTSTLPNDGKTTTAINLAIGVSQDVSQNVLLVDLDLGRPAIARSLGVRAQHGLSDYLRGSVNASDVIYRSDVDRLFLLPNFEPMPPTQSPVSPKMMALLEHIKRLDPDMLVIFDMSPVLVSDAVLAFGPHVDALLLIVSEGRTNRTLLKRATQMIENIPRVGTVLNRSTEGNAGGYY